MKRKLAFCLLLVLLLPILTLPASASSQGVIDAIEEQSGFLAEWFGQLDETIVGFSEIVTELIHWSTYYYETSIESIKTGIASIKSSITALTGFFKTSNVLVKYYSVDRKADGSFYLKLSGSASVSEFESKLVAFENSLLDSYVAIANGFYSLIKGDTTAADEFEDDLAPVETQVDEWLDGMETAPTINIEDIDSEADKITDFETDSNYMAVLSTIFLNDAFLTLFVWCVILAMLGFILYGKR